MAVASVSKITAASPTSFDAAVQEGVARASKTLRGITCLHVIEEKASNPGRLLGAFFWCRVWCDCRSNSASASETYTRSFRGRPEQARHGSQRACHRAQPVPRPTCGNGSDLVRHWPFPSASRRFSTSPAVTSGAEFPQVLRM